ncbi:hypothetical protein BGW39_004320, partial [Mortierella sp. 14UC]
MPNLTQHRDGGPPPPQLLPPIGPPPSPSYADAATGNKSIHKPKLNIAFIDPTEGHLAAAALAPKGARVGDLVNPRAVAYIVPKTVSPGAFSDAARTSHQALIESVEDLIPSAILNNNSYMCADNIHRRIELVYHELLDPATVSTLPVTLDNQQYVPLSSITDYLVTRFVFVDYHFQSSQDFGDNLVNFCKWYFETTKKMGKVLKVEIPLFPTPNGNYEARSQFAVYVKCDKTPEENKIDRQLSLGNRQKTPCRISWMGASPFCNYCKA